MRIRKHAGHDNQQTHRSNYGRGVVVVPDYINIVGAAATNPNAPVIDLLVRDDPNVPVYWSRHLRDQVAKQFDSRVTKKAARLLFNPQGHAGPAIACYDLVLRPSTGEIQLAKSRELRREIENGDYESDRQNYYAEIVKAADDKKYTFGVLYKASNGDDIVEDAHRDYATGDDLQATQWDYVRKGDRSIFIQHKRPPFGFQKGGEWVDIVTLPFAVEGDFRHADGHVEKRAIPQNSVWMGVVWEDWAWPLVKSGQISGYSFGGKAQRFIDDD